MAKLSGGTPPEVDLPAVAAILTAGLTYLVLRARTAPAWLGVSLKDEDGWGRVESAVDTVVRAIFAGGEPRSPAPRSSQVRNR
jgi:hypothetical protein